MSRFILCMGNIFFSFFFWLYIVKQNVDSEWMDLKTLGYTVTHQRLVPRHSRE